MRLLTLALQRSEDEEKDAFESEVENILNLKSTEKDTIKNGNPIEKKDNRRKRN